MFGFENISAHNGWSISIVGITIVFTGLTLLSLIISQLYKVLDFWEKKHNYLLNWKTRKKIEDVSKPSISEKSLSPDTKESARQYKMLVDRLGEPFSLPELLALSEKCGLDHPHATINKLILSEVIVPDGKGYYQWNI